MPPHPSSSLFLPDCVDLPIVDILQYRKSIFVGKLQGGINSCTASGLPFLVSASYSPIVTPPRKPRRSRIVCCHLAATGHTIERIGCTREGRWLAKWNQSSWPFTFDSVWTASQWCYMWAVIYRQNYPDHCPRIFSLVDLPGSTVFHLSVTVVVVSTSSFLLPMCTCWLLGLLYGSRSVKYRNMGRNFRLGISRGRGLTYKRAMVVALSTRPPGRFGAITGVSRS